MKKQEKEIMKSLGPCSDGLEWFAKQKNIKSAWANCHRADWMLWALQRISYNDGRTLRLFACRCVRETKVSDDKTVWDLLTDERSRNAVVAAERYANGESTKEEVAAAGAAAWAAMAAAGAAALAAAEDAERAAMAAAGAAAWAAALAQQANILREMIPFLDVEKLFMGVKA